ncbi:DUF4112 domain-containing protein [Halorarum salinum]|uniref:DUF4112 domain-containing protein n=1 Tax=Halorarum salinum TaxID=2743089 RepID=A0A7D5QJW5_9EURY|nr:DUF4112 domain-containing protein [Halobaculum salinum]QLG61685.1 DUF4112 domain-containing protein [Halobaculum salinum]
MDRTTAEALDRADEAALRRVRTVAGLMDEAVRVPGTSFKVGLDPILGAVPGAGDAVAAGISLYIVAEAANLGVPLTTIVKMLANVTVDAVGGSVPVVGVLFDAYWKANKWNVATIEEFLGVESGDEGEHADEPVTIDVREMD